MIRVARAALAIPVEIELGEFEQRVALDIRPHSDGIARRARLARAKSALPDRAFLRKPVPAPVDHQCALGAAPLADRMPIARPSGPRMISRGPAAACR